MRKRKAEPRTCACPCGETFLPSRANQKYINPRHKEAARAARSQIMRLKPAEVTLLNAHRSRKMTRPAVVTTFSGGRVAPCPKRAALRANLAEADRTLTYARPGALLSWREVMLLLVRENPEFVLRLAGSNSNHGDTKTERKAA